MMLAPPQLSYWTFPPLAAFLCPSVGPAVSVGRRRHLVLMNMANTFSSQGVQSRKGEAVNAILNT